MSTAAHSDADFKLVGCLEVVRADAFLCLYLSRGSGSDRLLPPEYKKMKKKCPSDCLPIVHPNTKASNIADIMLSFAIYSRLVTQIAFPRFYCWSRWWLANM